jgi:hypothetical protein
MAQFIPKKANRPTINHLLAFRSTFVKYVIALQNVPRNGPLCSQAVGSLAKPNLAEYHCHTFSQTGTVFGDHRIGTEGGAQCVAKTDNHTSASFPGVSARKNVVRKSKSTFEWLVFPQK